MEILGLGTDIVEIARIERMLDSYGDAFCSRVYTAGEMRLAGTKRGRLTFFAGRWAAKEAAAKALGCGIGADCAFTDIDIRNAPDGRPELVFSGAAARFAARIGVTGIKLSISHEASYAVATVLLTGNSPD